MLHTVPPHNPDAEDSVIGAMLASPKACERLLQQLEGDEFYYEKNRIIFLACRSLMAAGQDPDIILVADWLQSQTVESDERTLLELAGGKEHLAQLVYITTSTSNSHLWADIVKDAHQQRRLSKLLAKAQETLLLEGAGTQEVHDRLQAALLRFQDEIQDESNLWPAQRLVDTLEHRLANPLDETAGIPAPFTFLPPFKPSRLYVLGGYQGDGKSALAVQFMIRATTQARVGFVSMEMSAEDLANRVVATHGVPYGQVESGRVEFPKYHQRWQSAMRYLADAPLEVIDDPVATPESIDRYQRAGRYDFLIIDHLHRMGWDERRQLEQHVVAITNIARRHQIPVLLLAQLHRGQTEKFPRPTMKSFRESGMIEAEAAACYLIYRQRDDEQLPTAEAELIVAKNRYGPTLAASLEFNGEQTRFQETL